MAYSDDLSGAPDITSGGGGWDNLTATDNPGEPLQVNGGGGFSVWQKVHLASAGDYIFSHDPAADPGDTVMTVYTGPASPTYADLVEVGAGDDEAGSLKPAVAYTSPGGEWAYIASSGYASGRVSGQVTLWSFTAPALFHWVDCRSTPSFFGGFACDVGLYTGPWPLLPPGEVSGLSTSDEIDFYVLLPNPAAPTDVTVAGDGTYDTPVWDSWRYPNTPAPPSTKFGYRGAWSGPGASSPIPATRPAGCHLYAVAYIGSAPVHPPEFYVPASYAAGGAAAVETSPGHWSSAQAAYSETNDVTASGSVVYHHATSSHSVSSDANVATMMDTAISEVLAATPAAGSGGWPTVFTQKSVDVIIGGGTILTTGLNVAADVETLPFSGATALANDYPPGLDTPLVRWIDYYDYPAIGPDGVAGNPYRYLASPSWTWGTTVANGVADEVYETSGSGYPPDVTMPLGLPVRVKAIDGTVTDPPPWTVGGVFIEDKVSPSHEAGTGSGVGTPWGLDLSPVTALAFTLHLAPKFLYDGTAPEVSNYAMPSGGRVGYGDGPIISPPPTARITIARSEWEYWVPGAIVSATDLQWHTVGGHFATVGPAGLQILTPGRGWVDVVDGPA